MTLRNFQIFIEVCNQGSMSAAAQKLFISQSAISQIIKEMEKHYNTTLFRRVSHRLELTESGKKLYSHALKMVQYNSLIEASMSDSTKAANLRIGSFSAEVMIDIIAEYKKTRPELAFSLIQSNRPGLDILLNSSQLDVAIVGGIFNLSGFLQFPLTVFENIFACNINSVLSDKLSGPAPHLSLEELAQFPIYVCSISEDIEQSLHSVFLNRSLHYNIAGSFLHYNGVIEAAVKDLGIILVNRTNFDHSVNLLKEVKVDELEIRSDISLICPEANISNPYVKDFIEFAQNNFESIRSKFPSYRNL